MRARRLAIAIIVAICIGAPIAEMFDQWDHTYQDGSDTELNLVVIALCVGVGLSVASAMGPRVWSDRGGSHSDDHLGQCLQPADRRR